MQLATTGAVQCKTLEDLLVQLTTTGGRGELQSAKKQEAITVQVALTGDSGKLQLERPRKV